MICDKAMLELLYATGMRVSELVYLDLEHINMQGAMVRCPGKGDANEMSHLPATRNKLWSVI